MMYADLIMGTIANFEANFVETILFIVHSHIGCNPKAKGYVERMENER
jgi:hypothetical protein